MTSYSINGLLGIKATVDGNIVELTRGDYEGGTWQGREYTHRVLVPAETHRVYARSGNVPTVETAAHLLIQAFESSISRGETFDVRKACEGVERSRDVFVGAWITPLPAFVPTEQSYVV